MAPGKKRRAEGSPATERFTKVLRTGEGISQSNQQLNTQSSMAALFRANKLVHDLKESQLRTILVQAYISHPEIAHIVDLEHTKMEHIDEAPSDSDHEPETASDIASESESDDAGGGDDREEEVDESESEDETAKKNKKVTQVRIWHDNRLRILTNLPLASTTRHFRCAFLLL